MDDLVFATQIDDFTTLSVSPIAASTFTEFVGDCDVGSDDGYFVVRSTSSPEPRFEVLAKAISIEAAENLIALIRSAQRKP